MSQPLPAAAKIGKYEVIAHIATGGMGTVYKARDTTLGRLVALKVLAPRLVDRPAALERFRREARNAASLNHPNIVTLYEWGKAGDSHFLAMEFVDGIDLGDYIIQKGRLDVIEAHGILIQAVQALDHAHRQGVVHRDVKPSNFLLAKHQGAFVVKMTDLGLSRTVANEDFRVTRDGSTVGTIDYLSPEQSRDSSLADIRSDIYSLGCTAYHMLTGQPPFSEGGLGERIYKHLNTEPIDVRTLNPEVPPGLWAVITRMLAKDPGARYQTPAALLHDLQHLSSGVSAGQADPAAAPASARKSNGRRDTALVPSGSMETSIEAPEDDSSSGFSTVDQRRAAAGQFERASEVLALGDSDYARHLLLSCCQLDPANLLYRQTLRQIKRKAKGWLGRLIAPLALLACRGRLKLAQRRDDHLMVLQYGEEALAGAPGDLPVQLAMSDAAEALGLPRLAVWLVEQSRAQNPRNTKPLRALALLHERQGRLSQALRCWGMIQQEVPGDSEAQGKMNDLAAQETIERGNYKRRANRPAGKRDKPSTGF